MLVFVLLAECGPRRECFIQTRVTVQAFHLQAPYFLGTEWGANSGDKILGEKTGDG